MSTEVDAILDDLERLRLAARAQEESIANMSAVITYLLPSFVVLADAADDSLSKPLDRATISDAHLDIFIALVSARIAMTRLVDEGGYDDGGDGHFDTLYRNVFGRSPGNGTAEMRKKMERALSGMIEESIKRGARS